MGQRTEAGEHRIDTPENTILSEPLNLVLLRSGRVRLVCQFCDRRSGPRSSGRLSGLPMGWTVAPFPPDHVHRFDGSVGSLYTCPECAKNPIGRRPCLTRGLEHSEAGVDRG